MSFCRICRTENNLKYSLKELRRINKKLENNSKDLLYAAPASLTGNICYDCEERLHNFNKHINGDSDVDVDCTSVVEREESPVIVDDDELLYNLFFNKQDCGGKNKQQTNKAQQREFTQHSLGSDGDTEIIEVLTSSRESTPFHDEVNSVPKHFTMPNNIANALPIEVIDLEKDEKAPESDNEEIIFRRVETEPVLNSNDLRKIHRKRIRLSETETKLVASLSLLSSDSEDEAAKPLKNAVPKNVSLPQTYVCSVCKLNFLDLVALQTHQATHNLESCPVCSASFALSQRLVKHMRTKHRSYSGDTLKERQKCALDSAMTIRLRYLHRYTFYECQLCGKIDAVFKEHKEHIVAQHASESKSLNDPMMKELKCPICKTACGTQYMSLCEHLRLTHREKHSPHLKEVPHTHPFGWSTERQRDIEKTARVFQFLARKGRYFECISCSNVAAGYFNHWKHLSSQSCSALSYKNRQKSVKLKTEQVKQKLDTTKGKRNTVPTKKIDSKKTQTNIVEKTKKEQIREKKKAAPATKTGNNRKEMIKKMSKKVFKVPAMVKVKIKPRLLEFSTQEYICKYCKISFNGFNSLNVHQMKKHSVDEYYACQKCSKVFIKSSDLGTQQQTECSESVCQLNGVVNNNHLPCKHHRRKCRMFSTARCGTKLKTLEHYENSHSTVGSFAINENSLAQSDSLNTENSCRENFWLQDLMQFPRREAEAHQCFYCTRLFTKESLLLLHQQQHAEQEKIIIVKRTPCKLNFQ